MTFNIDTIWATLVAGAIVVLLGFWAARKLTKETDDHVPTKIQIIWEAVVGEVNKQVEDNLGKVNPFVVAARGGAVLLHPDRELARDHPERATTTTAATCCRRRPRTPT